MFTEDFVLKKEKEKRKPKQWKLVLPWSPECFGHFWKIQ
jgi:hypothetical protein